MHDVVPLVMKAKYLNIFKHFLMTVSHFDHVTLVKLVLQ